MDVGSRYVEYSMVGGTLLKASTCLYNDLIGIAFFSMLDRSLNSVLDDIERKNPLQMPPVEIYKFAEPESPRNIIFEGMTIKVRMIQRRRW